MKIRIYYKTSRNLEVNGSVLSVCIEDDNEENLFECGTAIGVLNSTSVAFELTKENLRKYMINPDKVDIQACEEAKLIYTG